MIQQASLSVESQWQKELKQSFTKPEDLLRFLNLDPEHYQQDVKARKLFNMRVPKHFASLMQKSQPNDPLLLQVLPSKLEFVEEFGFVTDPLLEHDAKQPGLLHKYKSRVLVMFKTGCAVNCRYCFRRHFPYADNSVNKSKLLEVLAYLKAHEEINEVILSGGDPLMADDKAIAWFVNECEQIPQLKRLRIHTRLPVVLPNRMTTELKQTLSNSRLQTVIVLHINHQNELSVQLKEACHEFKLAGITLLNQAVLLKGINDTCAEQVALSEALFDSHILPYYLHLFDKVKGASHFYLDDQKAKQIYSEMLAELPGFLVPKLVREIGGETSKTPVLP